MGCPGHATRRHIITFGLSSVTVFAVLAAFYGWNSLLRPLVSTIRWCRVTQMCPAQVSWFDVSDLLVASFRSSAGQRAWMARNYIHMAHTIALVHYIYALLRAKPHLVANGVSLVLFLLVQPALSMTSLDWDRPEPVFVLPVWTLPLGNIDSPDFAMIVDPVAACGLFMAFASISHARSQVVPRATWYLYAAIIILYMLVFRRNTTACNVATVVVAVLLNEARFDALTNAIARHSRMTRVSLEKEQEQDAQQLLTHGVKSEQSHGIFTIGETLSDDSDEDGGAGPPAADADTPRA